MPLKHSCISHLTSVGPRSASLSMMPSTSALTYATPRTNEWIQRFHNCSTWSVTPVNIPQQVDEEADPGAEVERTRHVNFDIGSDAVLARTLPTAAVKNAASHTRQHRKQSDSARRRATLRESSDISRSKDDSRLERFVFRNCVVVQCSLSKGLSDITYPLVALARAHSKEQNSNEY